MPRKPEQLPSHSQQSGRGGRHRRRPSQHQRVRARAPCACVYVRMCEGAAQVCELGVRDAGVAATVCICAYISYTMYMYDSMYTHVCVCVCVMTYNNIIVTYIISTHRERERHTISVIWRVREGSGVACCLYTVQYQKKSAYACTHYQGPGIQRLHNLGNLEYEWSEYGRGYLEYC